MILLTKMTKNDYIEKITQNLEHLTKDELKDVATLTNAQFGVRLKVAEKEYWEKEVEAIKSQLQQQALPVVPEFVAIAIESTPDDYSAFEALDLIKSKVETLTEENKDWLKNPLPPLCRGRVIPIATLSFSGKSLTNFGPTNIAIIYFYLYLLLKPQNFLLLLYQLNHYQLMA